MPDTARELATFEKNAVKQIVISFDEFRGYKYLRLVEKILGKDGNFIFTHKGFTIPIDQVLVFRDLFNQAVDVLIKDGIIVANEQV